MVPLDILASWDKYEKKLQSISDCVGFSEDIFSGVWFFGIRIERQIEQLTMSSPIYSEHDQLRMIYLSLQRQQVLLWWSCLVLVKGDVLRLEKSTLVRKMKITHKIWVIKLFLQVQAYSRQLPWKSLSNC